MTREEIVEHLNTCSIKISFPAKVGKKGFGRLLAEGLDSIYMLPTCFAMEGKDVVLVCEDFNIFTNSKGTILCSPIGNTQTFEEGKLHFH